MHKNTLYILFVYLVFNIGCSTQKQAVDPKLPTWAKNISSSADYYTGVGYAPKQKGSTAHYALANDNALNALASEISVQISANEVLVTISDEQTVRDNLSSIVQAHTSVSIEGYEKVDSYENKTGYWVYYRLSKQVHAQNELKKKQAASTIAGRKFELAINAEKQRNIKDAISLYAQSIDALKQYTSEATHVSIEQTMYDIIPESYKRITQILNEIRLITKNEDIYCKMGTKISKDKLNCNVNYQNKAIKNFPVSVLYSGQQTHKTQLSDENGNVATELQLNSEKEEEKLLFEIDKNEILKQVAIDYSIRNWILKIASENASITLHIEKPHLYIESSNGEIKSAFEALFINKNYPIAQHKSTADYIITLQTAPQKAGSTNGLHTVLINGKLSINLQNGKSIYVKQISPIKGVHLNYQEAYNNAYNNLLEQINTRYFKEVHRTIMNAI